MRCGGQGPDATAAGGFQIGFAYGAPVWNDGRGNAPKSPLPVVIPAGRDARGAAEPEPTERRAAGYCVFSAFSMATRWPNSSPASGTAPSSRHSRFFGFELAAASAM